VHNPTSAVKEAMIKLTVASFFPKDGQPHENVKLYINGSSISIEVSRITRCRASCQLNKVSWQLVQNRIVNSGEPPKVHKEVLCFQFCNKMRTPFILQNIAMGMWSSLARTITTCVVGETTTVVSDQSVANAVVTM
jgi:hypothetical protein